MTRSRSVLAGTALAAASALLAVPAVAVPTVPAQPAAPALPAAPAALPAADRATPIEDSAFAADALPTVQVDGIVWAVAAKAGRGYAGGAFANARPAGAAPGTQQVRRTNLVAFGLADGVMDPGFDVDIDGTVRSIAVSDDGGVVLIAGDFTRIDGQPRRGFAVLDARTGDLRGQDLRLDYPARAVAIRGSIAYLGGGFTTVGGQQRGGVAAVDLNTGRVLPFNAWVRGGSVASMLVSPDGATVVVGGQFTSVGSSATSGLARLDAGTGALLPTPISGVLATGGIRSGVYGLSGDARGFYVGGWKWNVVRGFEGIAAADWNGNVRWIADCHGDTEDVWASGTEVFAVGHPYSCATIGGYPENDPRAYHAMVGLTADARGTTVPTAQRTDYVDYGGWPAPRLTAIDPDFAEGAVLGQTAHAVDGEGDYMVVGGEFPSVNGTPQQGIARLGRKGVAPRDVGPQYPELGLRASSTVPGQVQVLVTPTWDKDDAVLTYRLIHGGQVIDERQVRSGFWARADYAVMDTRPAGSPVTYSLEVTDPAGNLTQRQTIAINVAAGPDPGEYARAVVADGAQQLWSPGNGPAHGEVRALPGLTPGSQLTQRAGAHSIDAFLGQGIGLDGSAGAYATSSEQRPPAYDVSVETWVRADPGTRPGRLIGFSPAADARTARNDRVLYLDTQGRVRFGTWVPNQARTLGSPRAITDGRWHHVVGTVDAVGEHRLYVDGNLVDRRVVSSGAAPQSGYWRVGADDMSLWPDVPADASTTARIDSPAVYERVLTPGEVATHLTTGAAVGSQRTPSAAVAGVSTFRFTHVPSGGFAESMVFGRAAAGEVIVGDWNGDGTDSVGYRDQQVIHVRDPHTTGTPTASFAFGRPGDEMIVGDWDGNGTDTVALRRGNIFYVKNSLTGGAADAEMAFGRPGDEVLVGDWDGDGRESIGLRRGNIFYAQDDFSGGEAEMTMAFGRPDDKAFLGDWNGDGTDTVALRRGNITFASNDFEGGKAPVEFAYGRATDGVLVGDWDGNGTDSLAMRRDGTYYVNNALRGGEADVTFPFPTPAPGTGSVLVGRWGSGPAESLALHEAP